MDGPAKQREAHTVTQDISYSDIFIFALWETEGTAVEVEMTVPTQITRGAPTKVLCQGRIRRCELKAGERAGMGTAIEKYEFLAGPGDSGRPKS